MPIYGIGSKQSQTTLEVLQAIGLLTNFDLPRKAQQGTRVYADCMILNDGVEPYEYFVRVYDRDTGAVIAESASEYINPTASMPYTVDLGLMPAKDWKLRAFAVHRDAYGGEWEGSYLDGFVYRWIIIPTILTITVTPSKVAPGESYKVTGTLTIQNTYTPANRTINIYRGVTLQKTVSTDVNGNYDSGAIASPLTPAVYTIKAEFPGVEEEQVLIAGAQAESRLGVGALAVDMKTIALILAPIVAGTVTLAVSER